MEEFDLYPPKPELIEPKAKGNLALTIFSVILFILVFLFIFTDEITFVFNLVLVLIIHEMGHFLMMKFFGYKNVRMLFIPLMGAFVQGSKEAYSQKQSILVVAAGPMPGILIGLVLVILAGVYQTPFMMYLGLLFLLLNIINLLPLDPLDGGQLFKLLIKANHELFLLVFSFISSLTLIGIGWFIDNWVLIAFGFIMGLRVRSIQNSYNLRKEMKAEEINYRTTYKLLTNRDFSRIKNILLDATPALRQYLETVPAEESEPLLASQVNSVLVSPVEQDASLFFRLVFFILWIASIALPFVVYSNFDVILARYSWFVEYIQQLTVS
jgi:stage IV sporulation protein FB